MLKMVRCIYNNHNLEHFIVWMSMSTFPTFDKLWGKIDKNLPKGVYTLNIKKNDFQVSPFNGTKSFVLKTTTIGGTNMFFSVVLFSFAFLNLFVLIFLYWTNRKRNAF